MKHYLVMTICLALTAVGTAVCTVLLANALHGLLATFMGFMTIALGVFTAYVIRTWHANFTNLF